MDTRKLRGVFVPAITPFKENGEIDFEGFESQISFLTRRGVRGIVVGGTTGEGHALSVEEKQKLIDHAMEISSRMKGKLNVIAATGTHKLEEAKKIVRHAEKSGCIAVLVLPPKTNDQEEIIKFHTELSKGSKIAQIAYNIPSLTGVHITPQTVARLVRKTNVAGVKDSSQNEELIGQWKRHSPRVILMVGEDKLIHKGVKTAKARGAIPGTGNAFPEETLAAFRAAKGRLGKSAQGKLNIAVDHLLSEGNFGASLKAIQEHRGVIMNSKRRIGGQLSPLQTRRLISRIHRAPGR